MLLKSADNKSKRLALLEELQRSALLNQDQKNWLRDEMMRLTKGIQGERESAYYLDSYFKDGENHVVLHDLRFIVDGEVAQIDHLIINRVIGIYLIETKNYAGNLVINEHGEFTVEYDHRRFGIPSPIEQSLRHERVLSKLLENMDIVGRTKKQTDFHHVVMLHPKAIIQRPSAKVFDTSNVIKADQFPTWHHSFTEKIGVGAVFKSVFNIRNLDTLKEWGEKLMQQHRPADLLALPDFMRPREPSKAAASASAFSAPASSDSVTPARKVQAKGFSSVTALPPSQEPGKRLTCAHCGVKVSVRVGQYCLDNAKRFGGSTYCMEHQTLFPWVA